MRTRGRWSVQIDPEPSPMLGLFQNIKDRDLFPMQNYVLGPKSTLLCFTSTERSVYLWMWSYSTSVAFFFYNPYGVESTKPRVWETSLSTCNIEKYVSFKPLVRQLNLAVKKLLHLHHAETNCFQYSVYILNKLTWLPLTMEYCLKSSWGFH